LTTQRSFMPDPQHGGRHRMDGGMADTACYTQVVYRRGRGTGVFRSGRSNWGARARVSRDSFSVAARCGAPRDKTLKFVKSEEAPRKTHLDESSSPTPLPHQTHARLDARQTLTFIRQGFAPQERKRAKTVATANGNASVVMVLGGTTPSPRSACWCARRLEVPERRGQRHQPSLLMIVDPIA
jgi:hypothetical protein